MVKYPKQESKEGPRGAPKQLAGGARAGKAKDGPSQPGLCVGGRMQGAARQSPRISSTGPHPALACAHPHVKRSTQGPSPATHRAPAEPPEMAAAL